MVMAALPDNWPRDQPRKGLHTFQVRERMFGADRYRP
jgi:hypothetical protein